MRTEVMYRDLPGGPLRLDFTDELPLSVLCSKCGMLSKNMFEDPSSHAFCSICIFESSDRKKIHCKYENTEVSVDEMMPAVDIVTIVMDQVVYCPNRGDGNSCNNYYSLKDLEGHYLECERTKIFCLSCGGNVKGREWADHVTSCPQQILQCRYCVVAVPRCRLEAHESVCNENRWAIRGDTKEATKSRDAETKPKTVLQNHSRHSDQQKENQHFIAPPREPAAALNTSDSLAMTTCQICSSKVKERNMAKHRKVCLTRHPPSPTYSTVKNEKEASQIAKKTEPTPTPTPLENAMLAPHEDFQHPQQRSPPNVTGFPDGRQVVKKREPTPTPTPLENAMLALHEEFQPLQQRSLPNVTGFSDGRQKQPTMETTLALVPASAALPASNQQFDGKTNAQLGVSAFVEENQTRFQAPGATPFLHPQLPSNDEASRPYCGSQIQPTTAPIFRPVQAPTVPSASTEQFHGFVSSPSRIPALADEYQTQPTTVPVTTPATAPAVPAASTEPPQEFANSCLRIAALANEKETASQVCRTKGFPHFQTHSNEDASWQYYGSQLPEEPVSGGQAGELGDGARSVGGWGPTMKETQHGTVKNDTSGYESDFEIITPLLTHDGTSPSCAPAPSVTNEDIEDLTSGIEKISLRDREEGPPEDKRVQAAPPCDHATNNMGEAGSAVVDRQPSRSGSSLGHRSSSREPLVPSPGYNDANASHGQKGDPSMEHSEQSRGSCFCACFRKL